MQNTEYLEPWLNQDHNKFPKNIDSVNHKQPRAEIGQ